MANGPDVINATKNRDSTFLTSLEHELNSLQNTATAEQNGKDNGRLEELDVEGAEDLQNAATAEQNGRSEELDVESLPALVRKIARYFCNVTSGGAS